MNSKARNVEYMSKDVPTIKKDVWLRMLFAVLFIVAFVWQSVVVFTWQDVSNLMIIVSCLVLFFSVMFGFVSIVYAMNDLQTLSTLKRKGKSIKRVSFAFNVDKRSFIVLYRFITSVFAVLALLLLIASATYSLLQFVYYSSVSFYLPMIFAFTVWCFNSAYHIKNEIYISENVYRCNSIYY